MKIIESIDNYLREDSNYTIDLGEEFLAMTKGKGAMPENITRTSSPFFTCFAMRKRSLP